MRTETLKVDKRFGDQYEGHYVFQEISWAKRSRIIQKYTKYHPITGQIAKADYVAIQAETISASLKEQPPQKPVTLQKLLSEGEDGIPIQLGELFSNIVNKLNNVSIDETRFLSEPSGEAQQTQQSQSSDSARNSDGPPDNSEDSKPKRSSSS